jgi:uncharacterized protein
MITGVAKRMAGQFFTAIDAELTGAAEARPTAAAVSSTDAVPAATPAAPSPAPQVSSGTPTAAPSSDLRTLAVGAVGGAGLTLLGVVVGWLLGRRRD